MATSPSSSSSDRPRKQSSSRAIVPFRILSRAVEHICQGDGVDSVVGTQTFLEPFGTHSSTTDDARQRAATWQTWRSQLSDLLEKKEITDASFPFSYLHLKSEEEVLRKGQRHYDRMEMILRHEVHPIEVLLNTKKNANNSTQRNTDFTELSHFLRLLQQHIVASVSSLLTPHALDIVANGTSAAKADNNDDDDDFDAGLFADEVEMEGQPSFDSNKSIMDALIAMLEASQLSPDFLGALEAHCRSTVQLVPVLLRSVLDRFDATLKVSKAKRSLPFSSREVQSSPQPLSSALIRRRMDAVTVLFGMRPPIDQLSGQALRDSLIHEYSASRKHPTEGSAVERLIMLRPVLCVAGISLPSAGMELQLPSLSSQPFLHPYYSYWLARLEELSDFPLSYFHRGVYKSQGQKAVDAVVDEARSLMKGARTAVMLVLKKTMAKKAGGRDDVFLWLSSIITSNRTLARMFSNEALSADGIAALASSRSFLYGMASCLLHLCAHDLERQLNKSGVDAFQIGYLTHQEQKETGATSDETEPTALLGAQRMGLEPEERRMVSTTNTQNPSTAASADAPSFTGATELFFLTSALLRIAIFPILEAETTFYQRYRSMVDQLEALAASQPQGHAKPPPSLRSQSGPAVAAMVGWRAALLEPDFAAEMTVFALTQLRWVEFVASRETTKRDDGKASLLALVPEWMCKLPAQWLSYVALHAPKSMQPLQAETAVACVTEILLAGRSSLSRSQESLFSAAVLTALIRVAGAFVQAGVRQAQGRNAIRKLRNQRGASRKDLSWDEVATEDSRELDIYSSLDHSDLGVTVFANAKVTSGLCPALMYAYEALDAAVGVDVDQEHNFEKIGIRGEISELLLRLWSHPSGECRKSVVTLPPETVAQFCASVGGNISVSLDFCSQRLSDACRSRKSRSGMGSLAAIMGSGRQDVAMDNQRIQQGAGNLLGARRELVLLYHLSMDATVAAAFAGKSSQPMAAKAAAMIYHFFDEFTDRKGNTKEELDFRDSASARTSSDLLLAMSGGNFSPSTTDQVRELVRARTFARRDIGLDLPTLCHLFLALASRWHAAAVKSNKSQVSPLLEAFANLDDLETDHLQCIARRYIITDQQVGLEGSQLDKFRVVLERDGYVDASQFGFGEAEEQGTPPLTESRRSRQTARTDQFSHEQISGLCPTSDIKAFLRDFEELKKQRNLESKSQMEHEVDVGEAQKQLLSCGQVLTEEEYGERLGLWVISSESFLSQGSTDEFAHYFGSTARGRNDICSGKALQREARRCQRMIPTPHPNAAAFLCYGEERMDLCRAAITGPTNTPYSLGVFVFDVFYPSSYPQVAPLVSFVTTGGGQMRFSPNLYVDGKVCISLLGTFHGTHESEKWNPEQSSLAQLLLSIQTQILVDEPYFTEPGYEARRHTLAGREASRLYNLKIRLGTLRHAIIGQLRCPPKGLEVVVRRHFSMCRRRLLAQARKWTMEARATELSARFERAYRDLVVLLAANERHSLDGDDDDDVSDKMDVDGVHPQVMQDALPPLESDMRALTGFDPILVKAVAEAKQEEDAKKKASIVKVKKNELASTTMEGNGGEEYNPWANWCESMNKSSASCVNTDDFDDIYE